MDDWFDELDEDPGPSEGDGDKPPAWAACLETRDRYEAFESQVRHWFKAQGMSVVISDAVVRARSADQRVTEVGLGTIAEACSTVPESQWQALVGGHFEGLYRVHRQHQDLKASVGGWNEVRKLLVARIWEPESLGDTRDAMVCREDIPGLVTTLALNLADHIRSVTTEEAAEWGRSAETLFETAIDNVEAMTSVDVSPIDAQQPDGIYSIFAESVLVAARALRFERFTKVHGEFGSLVSLPVRHAILAVPLRERDTILANLAALIPVTQQLENEGPGSVSSRVYWWRNGVWREVGYAVKGDRLEVAPPQELVDLIEGA